MKDVITERENYIAENLLLTFVQQTTTLNRECKMTLNAHQLLQLSDAMHTFGPLWSMSTFPFEDGIGNKLQQVMVAKHLPAHIDETHHATGILHWFQYFVLFVIHKGPWVYVKKRCSGTSSTNMTCSYKCEKRSISGFGSRPRLCKHLRCQVRSTVVHSLTALCTKANMFFQCENGHLCCFMHHLPASQQVLSTSSAFDVSHIFQCHQPLPFPEIS